MQETIIKTVANKKQNNKDLDAQTKTRKYHTVPGGDGDEGMPE